MNLQKNKLLAFAFALLIASSAFLVFSNSATSTVKAQTTSVPSNMLQYEWPMTGASPGRSFFNAGPAPNAPNIAWKAQIPGASGIPTAFNGLVFVSGADGTYALDAGTGNVVWKTTATGYISKIDSTYMVIGSTCVKIADGTTVWVGPTGFALNIFNFGIGYISDLKMFVAVPCGWSLPDPSKPPTLAWNLTSQENIGPGCPIYGDGKLFIGSPDGFLWAYDAKTGTLIWKTPTTETTWIYGPSYYNGKVIYGGLDNNMRAWDANTGKLLWTYNPQTFYGQWASSTGVAYGMVYEHNQDTYIYAINATTGQLVWRQKGPGVGYSDMLSIADGKVYCQMGENQYRDPATGAYAYSEYDCFDAYNGHLIWTLPLEDGAPFNLQCIAYGNLYVIPTTSTGVPGVWTYVFGGIGEVWCISSTVKDWPMFMADPAHTAEGAGPTNLQFKWNFSADAQIVSSPTAANGVVYFGTMNGKIYALDANTGSEKWAFTTGFSVMSSVAVVGGKLYTGADDGNVYCLDANTGTQLWKTPAGGITNSIVGSMSYNNIPPERSSPMVVGGKVYVGALDGNLYCLDANSGTVLWKFQTKGPILATPAVVGNVLYFPSCTGGYPVGAGPAVLNGDFYKLDANTGTKIYDIAIPYVLDKTFGSGNYIVASPTVVPDLGMVFLRNGFRLNYALNMTTGATIWTYDGMYNPGTPFQSGGVPQVGAPLYKYGVIYINDFYSISALNAINGSRIWSTYLSREDLAQGISYAYGRLYVVNQLGVLYVLDAATGQKLSYHEFGTVQLYSAPVPYNGNLYLGSSDWNLYCFGESRLMSPVHAAPVHASAATVLSQANVPAIAPVIPAAQAPATTSSPATATTLYIAAAAAVVIIVIAAAALLLRRKRK